jgi:O-antigen/teichoic acid export membrane protein
MLARHRLPTLVCMAFLFVLPLALFLSVTVGGATLLPADNLFQWEPFKSLASTLSVTVPQNGLLSDLILENYEWKRFILDSISQRELPLWNPYLFGGIPFLAAGQHSALYPLSILYYVLPLEKAYGWFTVVNLGLAGVFMFILMRTFGRSRAAATFAGVAYQLSGFMVVSVVFQMVIASAAWLPLILAMCERVIRQSPGLGGRASSAPWVILGAMAIGMHILAGHVEITVYTALITVAFCLWRLGSVRPSSLVLRRLGWLAVMGVLGAGLGAIQFVPLVEVAQSSFRAARSSFSEVIGYAFPFRHILLWLAPNFYGNPAHHTVFDLFLFTTQAVNNASGNTDWGIKNYVEGGAYVGILTLLLAGIAVAAYVARLARRIRRRPALPSPRALSASSFQGEGAGSGAPTGFFIVLGLFSVAFMFGTPLYAILYYGLPGINQLNSPFRWVFALTVCLAALAGFGFDIVRGAVSRNQKSEVGSQTAIAGEVLVRHPTSVVGRLGVVTVVVGALILAGLVVVRVGWPAFEPIVTQVYQGLAKAPDAYTDARMFFSYEARYLGIAAILMIAAGSVLMLARRLGTRTVWSVLAIGLLAVDLILAWGGFNPSVDPKLLGVSPLAIQFLQQDKSLWRLTTFDASGTKPLNANTPWLYHLQDIRGYDSIIPKQYVDYMKLIEPQGELMYNRIAPLSNAQSLESPLLDLLNVKYVLTTDTPADTISTPGFTEVFSDTATGGHTRIYRNERAMPRAFVLPATSALLTNDFANAVQRNDPRQYVMIDATCGITDAGCTFPRAARYTPAAVTVYKNNEVWVDAQITQTSWLILADSYYPGWKAFIRPTGGTDQDEKEVAIGLANGNFRAVKLDVGSENTEPRTQSTDLGGQKSELGGGSGLTVKPSAQNPREAPATSYTIRFKYSPDSVRIGAFASFVALVTLLFIAGVYGWRHFYHEGLLAASPIRRIAKNSLTLTAFNIGARLIDFVFAFLMLRVLGPEGAGKYAFAVVIVGWFDILMNFGLNTFLTREVSRDRAGANRYLYNTTVLRLMLGLGTAPLIILIVLVGGNAFQLASDTATAIALLAVSQVFSSLGTGLSALFFAYEKAEFPAALSIVSALIKVSIGSLTLLAGLGIVGLALTSIVVNVVTLVILYIAAVRNFFVPRREGDPLMRRGMLRESFPLMLNHLLATLFFKVDVPLLEAIQTPTVVGWYSTAYKYVDAFNIIPAYFTAAFFPAMSRMASETGDALSRAYVLALKLLVMIALPIAVLTTFLAPLMIGLLGGSAFLPHGAIALSIMIWSIPFGWINSVTNYALIAVNQQRALTRAFVIGLAFNVIANLIFLPQYSYQAAAVITILSELVEGAAFYFYVHRHITHVPWGNVLLRPVIAAALMAGVIYALSGAGLLIVGAVAGMVVYPLALVLVGALSPVDRAMLAPLVPARFRREVKPSQAS